MSLDRIQPQDLVKLQVKDRVRYGEVLQAANGIVRFRRLCPASGWHHATARQVVAHWRELGRRACNHPGSGHEPGITPPPDSRRCRSQESHRNTSGKRLASGSYCLAKQKSRPYLLHWLDRRAVR